MTEFLPQKPDDAGNDRMIVRARDLAQKFVDKTITESEADELLKIWERNSAVFRDARNDLEMDYILRYMTERRDVLFSFIFEPGPLRRFDDGRSEARETENLDSALKDFSAWLEKIRLSGVTFPYYTPRSYFDRQPVRVSFGRKALPWFAVCVVLLGAFSTVFLLNFMHGTMDRAAQRHPFQPIAVMTDSADEQWAASVPPFALGEPIFSGTLALESGWVELLFFNGTSVILEGPTDLTFLEPGRIFLRHGKISATVPPTGYGFETHTPHAVLTDLGTEFSIQVEPEQTAAHVIKGLVAVTPNGKPRILLEESGSLAARMDGVLEKIPFDKLSFVSETLMRKFSFDSPKNRQRRQAVRTVTQDLPLLKSELDGSKTEMASIRRKGGKFDAGRSEGSIAFRFQDRKDYLAVSLPQTLEAVTLAAWVCIDSLPERGNPLLMSREERRGGITWQVNSSGSVSIGIRTENRQLARNHESPILIGPERLGSWIHLAAVVDMTRGTVAHYLDGRIVYQASVSDTVPIRVGEATIGNRISRKTPIGNFHGRIDSFEIHGRALSPDELFNMYQDQKEKNDE